MTEKSYWYHHSDNVVYAVRYCDSDYCSVWKYEIVPNGQSAANPMMFIISSTLLGESLSTSEAATRFGTTASNWETVYFGNDEAIGAVQRVFSARGTASGSGTTASDRPGKVGFYWSSTMYPTSTTKFHLSLTSAGYGLGASASNMGSPVRLFHTNRDPYWGIEIGDIILSDGSWATTENIASRLSADNTLRPVAIVFATTTGTKAIRMPEFDTDRQKNGKGNYFHGYAMALRNCSGSLTEWCNNTGGLRTTLITRSTPATLTTLADIKADYKGFEYCTNAKAYCTTNGIAISNLYAIRTAETYSTAVAPSRTSGWFLPSVGQIYLELKAFYSSVITGSESWSGPSGTYYLDGSTAAVTAINNYIKGEMGNSIYTTYFQPFEQGFYHYTSTESDATHMYYQPFNKSSDDNRIKLSAAYTKAGGFTAVVRPILAF
jgi:hypothetical protein